MKYNIRRSDSSVILVTTLFLSVFLVDLLIRRDYDFEYLSLSVYDIEQFLGVNALSLIIYIVIKRGKQFILMFLLMKVFNAEIIYNTFLIVLCGLYAVIASVQCYYNGGEGLLTLLVFLFPHYIIYIFTVRLICVYCGRYKITLFKKNETDNYDYGSKFYNEKSKIITIFVILFVLGVVSEGIFSRFFLLQYYQYMVIN